MKKLFLVILLLVILVVGIYVTVPKFKKPAKQIDPTKNLYTLTNALNTSKWKLQSEEAVYGKTIRTEVEYKTPTDWQIELRTNKNHPNYATLWGPDKNSCIQFTHTSAPKESTLDQQLVAGELNVLVDTKFEGIDSAPATVISKYDILVEDIEGKIETVSKSGNTFMVAALEIDKNPNNDDLKQFVILSTCTMKESEIFTNVVNSVRVK